MATGPRYVVKFRRRRLSKTNYKKRFNLLKSGKTRLVLRKSNNYFLSQLINYNPKGDSTIINCSSSELKKYSWKHNFKNRPAAYLTGYLLAKKANDKKIKEVVLDLGFYNLTKGNKIFAFLRGIHDFGGVSFNYDEKIFPSDELLSNVHGKDISKDIEAAKSKIKGDKKK